MAVLTMTAGLLGILEIDLRHRTGNRFTVGNPRFTDIRLHAELAEHTVNENVKMQLTHPGDDGLPRILIGANPEGRVFLRQLPQCLAHFLLVAAALRFDRNGDHWLREGYAFEDNFLGVAERIACERLFQTQDCANIPRPYFGNILAAVGMHSDQATDTLTPALAGVRQHLALRQDTRIYTE